MNKLLLLLSLCAFTVQYSTAMRDLTCTLDTDCKESEYCTSKSVCKLRNAVRE